MGNAKPKNDQNTKKCKRVSASLNGVIAEQYTLDGWFVKVKPIFSLDPKNAFAYNWPSIEFSFVKKGSNGEGFDIYMDMDIFDLWADDVLDKTFMRNIESERAAKKQYPEIYKYVTGSNGEKSVGFCPGRNGSSIVINGCTVKDGKKVYGNVPVSYDWIRTLMKWYRRVTKSYYSMMTDLIIKGMTSNWNYNSQSVDDMVEYDGNSTQNRPDAPKQASKTEQTEIPADKPENAVKKPNTDYKKMEVVTSTVLKEYGSKNNLCFKAYAKNNKEYVFVVDPAFIDQSYKESWERFRNETGNADKVKATIFYVEVGNRLLVKGIA